MRVVVSGLVPHVSESHITILLTVRTRFKCRCSSKMYKEVRVHGDDDPVDEPVVVSLVPDDA